MSIPNSLKDRELAKFKESPANEVAVNICGEQLGEIVELLGGTGIGDDETLQFAGNVGTTPTLLPAVAGNDIKQVIVSCRVQTPSTKRLLFSLDNGTTFFTLTPGSMVGWEPKDIQQIQVKGNVASVDFDVIINRKA